MIDITQRVRQIQFKYYWVHGNIDCTALTISSKVVRTNPFRTPASVHVSSKQLEESAKCDTTSLPGFGCHLDWSLSQTMRMRGLVLWHMSRCRGYRAPMVPLRVCHALTWCLLRV
jgi:hypothetical protein